MDLEDRMDSLEDKIEYALDVKIGIPEGEFQEYKQRLSGIRQRSGNQGYLNLQNDFEALLREVHSSLNKTFANPSPRQIDAISRADQRPKMLDYIGNCFDLLEDGSFFLEILGEDETSVDPAIVCGIAKLEGREVMVIGHEKGTFEKYRNGGSAKPSGNRKAISAMKIAEGLNLPIITFVDTPGALPLEEELPSQTIARNIEEQGKIKVPHLSFVIGEGGSGGALAIDVCDRRMMAEKAYYSVISIRGAAAIIAENPHNIQEGDYDRAARNLRITAKDASDFGVADFIKTEPPLGARLVSEKYFTGVRQCLIDNLDSICESARGRKIPEKKKKCQSRWTLTRIQKWNLVRKRYQKYRRFGSYEIIGEEKRIGVVRGIEKLIEDFGLMERAVELYYGFQERSVPLKNRVRRKFEELLELVGIDKSRFYWLLNKPILPPVRKKEDGASIEIKIEGKDATTWVRCPNSAESGCEDLISKQLYETDFGVCHSCNYHFRIPVDWYIALIADNGSFKEFNQNIASTNPLGFEGFDKKVEEAKRKTGKNCALSTGYANINGVKVVMITSDMDYRGGTLGCAEGEKYVRAVERAIRQRLPIVAIIKSGGVRIQEGSLGLMQMVKTALAASKLKEYGIPYICVQADPCMAGTLASYASLANIRIGEPNAQIGFAGPKVVSETIKRDITEKDQYAEEVLKRGGLELVCNRTELKTTISEILDLYRTHTSYEYELTR